MCDEPKEYLTTKECGRLIGRSAGAIRNLVLRKQIPHRKPSGRLLFIRSEIEKWIVNAPGVRPEDIE
jgi:predicted DNA-binding transcriptional regulator AlpA